MILKGTKRKVLFSQLYIERVHTNKNSSKAIHQICFNHERIIKKFETKISKVFKIVCIQTCFYISD